MNKQKPKDWKITKFLKDKAPKLAGDVLELAGDLTGVKLLNKIGDKINASKELTTEDKELALKKLEMDAQEIIEVSKRWQSDMNSDSWLSKNVRPLTLAYLTLITTIYIILDSLKMAFEIDNAWIELLKTLLVTIYVAYFGSRGFEKYTQIKK